MKVNKILLSTSLANALKSTNSLTKIIELIYHLELIDIKKYEKLNNSLKENYDLEVVLNILELDNSLVQYTLFFNNYYSLAHSLEMSIALINEIKSFKNEMISSLIYPTILVILSLIALLFVSNYIIPQLVLLNPNGMTNFKIIITILNMIPIILLSSLSIIFITFIVIKVMLKRNYKTSIKQLAKLPLFNKLIKFYCSFSFIVYLKETTKSLPFNHNCIQILYHQINNKIVTILLDDMLNGLNRGEDIIDIIKSSELLNKDLKYIIQSCINSKEMSIQLNNFYDLKLVLLKKRMKMFISILVPIVVSAIGILLIIMYILIMMPILDIDLDV